MVLHELKKNLDVDVLAGEEFLDRTVEHAFASDLMSDVLAFGNGCDFLITGLANAQAIRTAEMLDINCILFVRGKNIDDGMVQLAKEKDFIIMSTPSLMYSVCGKLSQMGLKGVDNE